jgi:hypothetical protein
MVSSLRTTWQTALTGVKSLAVRARYFSVFAAPSLIVLAATLVKTVTRPTRRSGIRMAFAPTRSQTPILRTASMKLPSRVPMFIPELPAVLPATVAFCRTSATRVQPFSVARRAASP